MKQALKRIYQIIPLKKQIYQCLRWLWIPPKSIYHHLHFKDHFRVSLPSGGSFRLYNNNSQLENEIFWEGLEKCWEKKSLEIWQKLCRESDVILDIGAYTGIYSLIAKTVSGRSRVYTFEPSKEHYSKLAGNSDLNHFDIRCLNFALLNKTGQAHVSGIWQSGNKITETMRLDDFIKKEGINKIDLVKLDVELHEVEVLEGFGEYLHEFKPDFIIEVLNDEIGSKIEAFFTGKGYVYFNIDENSGIQQVEHITKSTGYNYLICKQRTAEKLGLTDHEAATNPGII